MVCVTNKVDNLRAKFYNYACIINLFIYIS